MYLDGWMQVGLGKSCSIRKFAFAMFELEHKLALGWISETNKKHKRRCEVCKREREGESSINHQLMSQHCSVCAPLTGQHFRPTSVHASKFVLSHWNWSSVGLCKSFQTSENTHTHARCRAKQLPPALICQWPVKGKALKRTYLGRRR